MVGAGQYLSSPFDLPIRLHCIDFSCFEIAIFELDLFPVFIIASYLIVHFKLDTNFNAYARFTFFKKHSIKIQKRIHTPMHYL